MQASIKLEVVINARFLVQSEGWKRINTKYHVDREREKEEKKKRKKNHVIVQKKTNPILSK